MPTLENEIEFEVWCEKCGAGLCNDTRVDQGLRNRLYVKPCERCLDEAMTDGKEEGHDEGYREGEESGWNRGRDQGRHEGRKEGFSQGKQIGYDEGYRAGIYDGEARVRHTYR